MNKLLEKIFDEACSDCLEQTEVFEKVWKDEKGNKFQLCKGCYLELLDSAEEGK